MKRHKRETFFFVDELAFPISAYTAKDPDLPSAKLKCDTLINSIEDFIATKFYTWSFAFRTLGEKKKRSQSCYANHRCAFQTKPLAKIPKKRELKIAVINLSHDRKRSRNFVADGNAIRSKAFFLCLCVLTLWSNTSPEVANIFSSFSFFFLH